MSKNVWIIGPGTTLNKYKNLISKLNTKTTIVLGKVFPHCINHFNLHPTFWTWYDPHEVHYAIPFLKKDPNYTINCLLPSPLCKSEKDFYKYNPQGNSYLSAGKNIDLSWGEYEQFLKNKQLDIKWVDSITLHRLWFESSKYRKIEGWKPEFKELAIKLSEDPHYRFNKYNKVVINTHYSSYEENTLNRSILPLCHHMGYEKVFILGFDGLPGRFFKKWKTSPYVSRFDNLKKWVDWKSHTNMEVLSVIPGPIDKHIPSINFEKALEIDR
jgi:hypothetical protein